MSRIISELSTQEYRFLSFLNFPIYHLSCMKFSTAIRYWTIYIYIYIYIVIHRQTVSFYQNSSVWLDTHVARSSVARHARRSKPGSKPVQLYLRPLGHQADHREFFKYLFSNSSSSLHFVYIFIPYRLPECSILSKSFALCERRPTIPSPDGSTPMGERIYCHPQTDCFVLSELFSVARHARCSKPGSKPVQLYVRLNLRPLGHQVDHVG